MSDAFPCPDLETLRHYLADAWESLSTPSDRGRQGASAALPENASPLPDSNWHAAAVESHVECCERCQVKLEELLVAITSKADSPDRWDDVAERVRGASTLVSPSPALEALIQRVSQQRPDDDSHTHSSNQTTLESPPLEFLAPSESPGVLGRLGDYDILEVVGRGGMGIVFKAYDPSLRRVVAIKVMAPHLASSGSARRRFVREARAAAAVSHEHVVAIHGVEEQHEPPFLVMQFVGGRTLHQRLADKGPLTLPEILRIGAQAAAGLAAAHAQGLVHRDIKPANILLENGVERVKITDFGLARAVDDVGLTQTGVVAGTPQFMAPEQANGELIDHRTDLFSLGSVLYTLCVGHPPFRSTTTLGMLKRVCEETPRSIREFQPELPEWLDAIIAKLMAKRPEERYQTAAEVAALLEQWLAHLQRPAAAPRPAAQVASAAQSQSSQAAQSDQSVCESRVQSQDQAPVDSRARPESPTAARHTVPRSIDWQAIGKSFLNQFRRHKPLGEAYPSRAQLALLFLWGTFMIPWIASLSPSHRFLEVAAAVVVLAGLLLPIAFIGVSWWQYRLTLDWSRTILRASPRRLLLFPTLWLFVLSVVFWGYRHTTTGVIEFDVDDPQFTVTIMGPSIPQASSYAANFYALRVAPGDYSWHVMTVAGSTPIQAGQLKVEPRRRSSLIVRSPHPLGQAELAFLPGRWELRHWGVVKNVPQTIANGDNSNVEYVDVTKQLEMVVHSQRLLELLEEWSAKGETGAAAVAKAENGKDVRPENIAGAGVEYRLLATRASATVRGWMMVDVMTQEASPRVVARGILSADQQRLNLRLAPPSSPRVDSWGDSPSTPDARTLMFERASDLALFQGEWEFDAKTPDREPTAKGGTLTITHRRLRASVHGSDISQDDSATAVLQTLIPSDNGIPIEWSLSLLPASQPKRVTLTARLKPESSAEERILVVECLYQIDEKNLTLAIGKPGAIPSSLSPDSPGTLAVARLHRRTEHTSNEQ